ncbi:MAG TPA: DUF5675 family protein [Williamwhitmania sp.]|nr:DUF5675 family protein [Williamwhitmania sp.]
MIKPDLILNRINYTEWGCQGLISVPVPGGDPYRGMANAFAVTLEPDWAWNKPFISCVPKGLYSMQRINSPKFGWTYTLIDVEDRSLIRFHTGTKVQHTEGCILLGESFEDLKQLGFDESNQLALSGTKDAHAEFMDFLNGKEKASILIIGNSAVETDLILQGIDIKRRSSVLKTGIKELSLDSKVADGVTRLFYAVSKGVSQYSAEKKMTAPPKWKKIVNYIFNIVKIAFDWYIKTKGIILLKP